MPITWTGANSNAQSNTTSIVINQPIGSRVGDTLIVALNLNSDSVVTAPAGWAEIVGSGSTWQHVFWKRFAAGDTSYTFSFGFASAEIVISGYREVRRRSVTPILAVVETSSIGGVSHTYPAFSTNRHHNLVVAIGFQFGTNADIGVPSGGYTTRAAVGNSGRVEISDRIQALAGTVAASSSTNSTNTGDSIRGVHIGLASDSLVMTG